MSKNKESYLHRMAKELLYSQIMETDHFDTKDRNGLRVDDIAVVAHQRHRQALADGFSGTEPVTFKEMEAGKNRWHRLNVYMEYVIDTDLYNYTICKCDYADEDETCNCTHSTSGAGYHPCSGCPHADTRDTIIHDIAVVTPNYYNHIVYAIEIVHKHYPKWEGKDFRPYPTYIIKAANILKRIKNTPVFIERVI